MGFFFVSESDIIIIVMREICPILYWPKDAKYSASYSLARKSINKECGNMPNVAFDDADLMDVMKKNPDCVLYYPIFCESTGWWGELLGGDAYVNRKVIVSPECQLMEIKMGNPEQKPDDTRLMAAEITPSSGFFKKMNASIATVSDMLATDTGTILALFTGKNPKQFINVLESTGNSYLGCIGRY